MIIFKKGGIKMNIFGSKHRYDDIKPDLNADAEMEKFDAMALAMAMASYVFPIVIGIFGFFALLTWIVFH